MSLNIQDFPKGKIFNSVDEILSNENGKYKRLSNKM